MVTKRVTEGAFEGQTIPLAEQARLQKLIVFRDAEQEVYANILNYETQVRLQKWTQKMIKQNFESLHQIVEEHKAKTEQEAS